MISGMFDTDFRMQDIDKNGDPLVALNKAVDWEIFRPQLEVIRQKKRKSTAGRKPFDVVLMFKILVLQSLYNLSDDSTEFQIQDRLSFMRFLGLGLDSRIPDAKTIWLFREDLTNHGLVKTLFEQFDAYLWEQGFRAQKGQIVDASIIAAPRQRNTRKENRQIKEGDTPEDWPENKRRQKDTDARWTKKNGITHYGYKNHISIDAKHKFVRNYDVTDASVHDSQVFEDLLDPLNSSGDVWADSAYRSKEKIDHLESMNYRPHIQRKATRGKALSEWEQQGNRTRARTRARVEHVFGVQAQRAGTLIVRTIGRVRAKVKIGLRNLSYNLDRYSKLSSA
jgi:transposase, IS5 family